MSDKNFFQNFKNCNNIFGCEQATLYQGLSVSPLVGPLRVFFLNRRIQFPCPTFVRSLTVIRVNIVKDNKSANQSPCLLFRAELRENCRILPPYVLDSFCCRSVNCQYTLLSEMQICKSGNRIRG